MTTFKLSANQKKRMDAWFQYHWDVVHANWRPRDSSGFAGWHRFGPTLSGCNTEYHCAWCKEGDPKGDLNMTEDDDGDFIYEYDETWKRLPASWERPIVAPASDSDSKKE